MHSHMEGVTRTEGRGGLRAGGRGGGEAGAARRGERARRREAERGARRRRGIRAMWRRGTGGRARERDGTHLWLRAWLGGARPTRRRARQAASERTSAPSADIKRKALEAAPAGPASRLTRHVVPRARSAPQHLVRPGIAPRLCLPSISTLPAPPRLSCQAADAHSCAGASGTTSSWAVRDRSRVLQSHARRSRARSGRHSGGVRRESAEHMHGGLRATLLAVLQQPPHGRSAEAQVLFPPHEGAPLSL